MNLAVAQAYVAAFFATSTGQATLAIVRVFLATLLGCWLTAGSPLPPSAADLSSWVAVAGSAAVSLVIANYLGPWEKRYGRK